MPAADIINLMFPRPIPSRVLYITYRCRWYTLSIIKTTETLRTISTCALCTADITITTDSLAISRTINSIIRHTIKLMAHRVVSHTTGLGFGRHTSPFRARMAPTHTILNSTFLANDTTLNRSTARIYLPALTSTTRARVPSTTNGRQRSHNRTWSRPSTTPTISSGTTTGCTATTRCSRTKCRPSGSRKKRPHLWNT
jgi:hypothetical protein